MLVQLPIPPANIGRVQGNVPLAAGYLKLFAKRQGLDADYQIDILPPSISNNYADQGIVEAILSHHPWMVGFSCYLWNIERTLAIAAKLKSRSPEIKIILGGPEIMPDNAWVLENPCIDYAVFGEGEQTFTELLAACRDKSRPSKPIAGLWTQDNPIPPLHRPLQNLDAVSSPYLEGILDPADGQTMFLETVRGCLFQCRFCYYPKRYDSLHYLSSDQIEALFRHAQQHGVEEIFLLDPTINQRPDFVEFLHLLARLNPNRQFSISGELRAEGIDAKTARLLHQAGFNEVEIGLQSIDPKTQELMDRKTNLRNWQRGVRAIMDQGIQTRIDLIIGLPGDTPDSIRRGIDYLAQFRPEADMQVFNLSILPGTSFRKHAQSLGLKYQSRPPYYVLQTPTLDVETIFQLMEEAQDAFGMEFDPQPPPALEIIANATLPEQSCMVDLDKVDKERITLPPSAQRALAFVILFRSDNFQKKRKELLNAVKQAIDENPFTTLNVVLEPSAAPTNLSADLLQEILSACYTSTSYLDRFYSLHPGRLLGAKRLFILLPLSSRSTLDPEWLSQLFDYADILWQDINVDVGHAPRA